MIRKSTVHKIIAVDELRLSKNSVVRLFCRFIPAQSALKVGIVNVIFRHDDEIFVRIVIDADNEIVFGNDHDIGSCIRIIFFGLGNYKISDI